MARMKGEISNPIMEYLRGVGGDGCAELQDIVAAVRAEMGDDIPAERVRSFLNYHAAKKRKDPRVERCGRARYRLRRP